MNQPVLAPCPNPWCEGTERGPDYGPAIRLHHFGSYRVVCTSCILEGPLRPTKAEAADAWNTRPGTDGLREALVVREIETVTGDFYTEPGKPFWRIEVDGYCADFDYPEAAQNFANAVNARLAGTQTDEMVAALEDIANPLAALERDAEAQGRRLSGMAYQIANDPEHLKSIARAALAKHKAAQEGEG